MNKILNGREERVVLREEFIKEYKDQAKSFLTITINMPGSDKNLGFVDDLFVEAVSNIKCKLYIKDIKILSEENIINPAGPALFLAIDLAPEILKRLCIELEENHIMGRLFDLDVHTIQGGTLSRTKLGYQPRRCIICEDNAKHCIRLARHRREDLLKKIKDYQQELYDKRENFAKQIEVIAYQAMLDEVSVTPKPGLVDLNNSGCHNDMDIFTFKRSSAAIKPYFSSFVQLGMNKEIKDEQMLAELRLIGIQAEEAMFAATEGINTQKGIIFSLGLLTAAVGRLYIEGSLYNSQNLARELTRVVSYWVKGISQRELGSLDALSSQGLTHGQRVYKKYGFTGARGEAEGGFKNVLDYGLPSFKSTLDQGAGFNEAAIYALISIMANLNDINIAIRSDLKTLEQVQNFAQEIVDIEGVFNKERWEKIQELKEFMEAKHISPGGAADLLVVTLFLYNLEDSLQKIV